ncbi:hypothetical protein EV147_4297 [Cupriavidus agavae]|uniref:Uncharacterized protein n=1 Tax=Cupriavidus agavae TaxID=1001822 RepID=A0A4Q7RH12_9BURK|nr:hypothetical protein EV147_4297 [Cupriavidus agavae]
MIRNVPARRPAAARLAVVAACLAGGTMLLAGCERNPPPGPGPKPISGAAVPAAGASGAATAPR